MTRTRALDRRVGGGSERECSEGRGGRETARGGWGIGPRRQGKRTVTSLPHLLPPPPQPRTQVRQLVHLGDGLPERRPHDERERAEQLDELRVRERVVWGGLREGRGGEAGGEEVDGLCRDGLRTAGVRRCGLRSRTERLGGDVPALVMSSTVRSSGLGSPTIDSRILCHGKREMVTTVMGRPVCAQAAHARVSLCRSPLAAAHHPWHGIEVQSWPSRR